MKLKLNKNQKRIIILIALGLFFLNFALLGKLLSERRQYNPARVRILEERIDEQAKIIDFQNQNILDLYNYIDRKNDCY